MKVHFLIAAVSWLMMSLSAQGVVKGFSLTELGEAIYETGTGDELSLAQIRVNELYELGVRHINLHPRAIMKDPKGSEIEIRTPLARRTAERRGYINLIRYIKSKGMTVGLRPIFFVVDANGNTPFVETQADGTEKIWWHGNIQPRDPNLWFESFKNFLDNYAAVARLGQVEEFTIGAELYSMTVGIEDQWAAHPHGFPGRWSELLTWLRGKLGSDTRIMYDINFTDDTTSADGVENVGGEFARWKYRLVDNADPADPVYQELVKFWTGLDAIGIDMYRSLATDQQVIPADRESLTSLLEVTASRYAGQMDSMLFEIELQTGVSKKVILKEVGFRSVENAFIRPFEYADSDNAAYNEMHQAASYEALLRAFMGSGLEWFDGVVLWDASVAAHLHGSTDRGFSPIGKTLTEEVLKKWFLEQ